MINENRRARAGLALKRERPNHPSHIEREIGFRAMPFGYRNCGPLQERGSKVRDFGEKATCMHPFAFLTFSAYGLFIRLDFSDSPFALSD